MTIHQYLLQLRLREGAAAVLEGERDLTALGLRLGFSHHSHFTEAFRRAFGVPPSRLRSAEQLGRLAVLGAG
jgi:AraC-like DNA-binding protein